MVLAATTDGPRTSQIPDTLRAKKDSPAKTRGVDLRGGGLVFAFYSNRHPWTLPTHVNCGVVPKAEKKQKELAKARTPKFGALFSHIFCLPVGLASINFTISETGPSLGRLRALYWEVTDWTDVEVGISLSNLNKNWLWLSLRSACLWRDHEHSRIVSVVSCDTLRPGQPSQRPLRL